MGDDENERMCGGCGGQGGRFVTDDAQKPGKMRWERCTLCNGTGRV